MAHEKTFKISEGNTTLVKNSGSILDCRLWHTIILPLLFACARVALDHSLRGLSKLVNLMELYCGNNDIAAASEVILRGT